MRQNRLRRALLPTWPPENASEAMLLLLCAAALRLLIELWTVPAGAMLAQPDVATAALALLGALARPMALGLLLALAAFVLLKVPTHLALGLGALMLAGTWVLPLASGIAWLPPETETWITVVPVAFLALVAAYVVRTGFLQAVLLGLVAPLLAVAVASWDLAHAWALDTLGLSVRGALVFGIAHARREALDAMPLLALCLAAWMLPGGSPVRRMLAPGGEAAPWHLQLGGACAVVLGFVGAGVALGVLPGILQPPGVYGLAALLAGLGAGAALVAGLERRRAGSSRSPSVGALGILAAWALALCYVSGPLSLPAVALVVALLALDLLLPPGRRPGVAIRWCRAAAIGVILWWAGSAIVPGAALAPAAFEVSEGGFPCPWAGCYGGASSTCLHGLV